MNIYLSKKQQEVMKVLLDAAEDLIKKSDVCEIKDYEEFNNAVFELKSKVNGSKKMAKNGVVLETIEVDCLNSDDKLVIRAREDGRAVILESKSRVTAKSGRFLFNLGKENSIILTNHLIKYLDAWGMDYKAEDKSYSEEINVFADEVERSISLCDGRISFQCYTDDKNDEHWTFLTPYKTKYFVELMLGYINEQEVVAVGN